MSDDEQLADRLKGLHITREAAPVRHGGASRWLVPVLLLALVGGGTWYLVTRGEARLFPEEVQLGAVTLVSPQQADVTLVATGYVYSRRKATVAPKITGRIAKLLVDEGDAVKMDQLIAELDSADAQAQAAQVRADVAAARAKVERARADLTDGETRLAREQKLLASNAGTPAAVDDARARVTTARAQLAAAEADVGAASARHQAAQVQLDNTRVRAPFDGTVLRKLTEVGEVVTPAGAGLFTVADLANLEVQADVGEAQLSKVRAGTPADIILDAFPEHSFRGQVKEIRQTVDRAKATVTVKVSIENAKGVLPDMAAKVSFLAHALAEADAKLAPKLVAPPDAVVDRGGRKVLLTVDDGRIREVAVQTGPAVGTMIELTSGPTTGTRVVRHPAPKLVEGSSVKEKETK